jgi:hypothetical protein
MEDIDAGLPGSVETANRERIHQIEDEGANLGRLHKDTKGRQGITLSGLLNAIVSVVFSFPLIIRK